MFETPDGIIDISGYTQQQRVEFFQKYPEAIPTEAQTAEVDLNIELEKPKDLDKINFLDDYLKEEDFDREVEARLQSGGDIASQALTQQEQLVSTTIAEEEAKLDNFKYKKPKDVNEFFIENKLETLSDQTFKDIAPEKTEFTDEYYKGLEGVGIKTADFEGMLNSREYSSFFKEQDEKGTFSTLNPNVNQKDLPVIKQRLLAGYLDEYVRSVTKKYNAGLAYKDYTENPSKYKGIDDMDEVYDIFVKENGVKPAVDTNKYYSYYEKTFPDLVKKEKENEEAYQEYVNNEIQKGDARRKLESIASVPLNISKGWMLGVKNFIDFGGELATRNLGMSTTGLDASIFQEREKQMSKPENRRYISISGKTVEYKGKKYLKDTDGNIYDTDIGLPVNKTLDEKELKRINSLIDIKGVEDVDYSLQGFATQGAQMLGDIIFQIGGTFGAGRARVLASEKYLAKYNGFKNASQFRTYQKMGYMPKAKNVGTFGQKMPIDARRIDAMVFTSANGAQMGYQSTLQEAKLANIKDDEAEKLANIASIQMGVLYAGTGTWNPRIKTLNSLDDYIAKQQLFKNAINQYLNTGSKKAFGESIKSGIKSTWKGIKNFGYSGTSEASQEIVQQGGETYIVNGSLNRIAGKDFLIDYMSNDDIRNTMMLSIAAGGTTNVNLKGVNFKPNPHAEVENLFKISRNIPYAQSVFNKFIERGKLTREQADDILKRAEAIGKYQAPAWMLNTPKAYIDAATKHSEVQELKLEKESLGKEYHKGQDVKIKKSEDELQAIIDATAEGAVEEEVSGIEKIVGKENIKIFKTTDEFKAAGFEQEAETDGLLEKDGVIYINKEQAVKTKAISVASHELLHKVLGSEFKNNAQMPKIVKEFKNILASKGILEPIEKRAEMYRQRKAQLEAEGKDSGGFDVDGKDADEYFTFFSDAIAKNEISFKALEESQWKVIGRKIIDLFRTRFGLKNAEFTNGQQVFDFIRDYQENIKKGKLSAQAKKKLADYTPDQLGTSKKSLSLLENINNLVPKNVSTKEEFQSREVFNPIFNATQPGGAIYNYVNSRALSKEEAEITLEGVVDRLINFDPAAVRKTASGDPITFGEFLFANARFSKLDAKKRLAIESERQAESLDTEEARQVAEPVAETTTTEAPRVEYKNLVESKVLPADMVAKVKDKILLITKTLKSRIDAATSINKTVTPLMSEIKKEIGKQADIEFKKMLGAKRGGELKNNFLKLKKPILENMTTTWLMQGMPFAIQKSVDGKFTSDWEGKKIDRESVGTDKAGRTSGAQLARRLPNAANKITDDQFLTYMFKGDEVIRGRKEALAKALAEEYAFDVYSQELYDGEVRKAFEDNQERLGVELSDNFVQEFNKQAERGNVKRSLSQTQTQEIGILTKAIYKKGYDNIIEKGVIIDDDLAKFSKESIDFISRIWDEGLIVDFGALGFLKGIKMSNVIPESIKEISKKAVTKVSSKQVKDALAKDSKKIAMKLGSDVINITGLDGVGFHNRILDPAATKKNKITKQLIPGATGEYFNVVSDINKNIKPSKNLPKNLDLSKVRLMNSSMGLMSKINTILNKDISTEEKQNQYKKYIPEIQEANIHNKILANHIITTMVGMVKSGEITPQSYVNILQLQTQAAKGLRALTGLKYITFKNGPQGKIKGEHLADNSTSMLEFAELAFSDLNENQLNNSINDILEFHDQWLENKNTLDFVDVFGRNNPFKDKRINILPAAQQKFVFTFDLMPAATLIDSRSKTIDNLVKIRKGQAEQAKINIKQKALNNARKRSYSENSKGISVYDFDDTLAFSKSQIIVKKDGKTFKINAAQFAKQGETLLAEGAEFDFSEFNKVVKGQPGPLIPRIQKAIDKFGNKNIFILTARPVASESAIHAFMKGLGIDIPRANITGLANSTAQAKADWMVSKVAEGFNDFYFVDDAIKNVQAVKDVLETFDVNSKVQQAIANRKRSMSADLNEMIERNKGVRAETTYSKVLARKKGAKKGKFKFFVPYSAEDFKGLTSYTLAGKGKQGEADQKLFNEALILPYTRGIAAMEGATQALKNDYKNLLDMFGLKKELPKKIGDTDFTTDQAVRVYLWDKQGFDIPNISKRDQNKLSKLVAKDPDLVGFAEGLMAVSKKDNWVNPKEHWDVGSILKDLNDITDNVNRKEYLAEFIENVDEMFDKNTLNKLEAIYGTNYVEALQDSIRRMKSGSNSPRSAGKIEQKWLNWVNNSVGTIMFFNRRSALLQMLSFTNFINWSDNNPAKAAAAFANQPLYWKKWVEIFNSDKLKERRGGLKSDIQESEIANQAKNSKDKASAVISYLLKIGFTPTQIADSFAIATGGATFLINRTKKYEKQGLSKKEAEAKAFEDFGRISDETQQSGDPMLISQQQASHLGRLVLAFQNTPMQYVRLMKKAGKDIINRRGSDVENLSKIAYYGFVQNLIFSSLQSALFALIPGFDDEEEEDAKVEDKVIRTANSMVDTILRGTGLAGAVISTLKNAIMRYQKEDKKGYTADHTYTMIELANVSPPIGSKLRKVYSAIQTKKFNQAVIDEMGYGLTLDGKFNPSPNYEIIANVSSAVGNLPLDRLLSEVKSINEAFDSRNTSYQRLALALGWRTWGVNVKNEEQDLIKVKAKAAKKEAGKQKAKDKRRLDKIKKFEKIKSMGRGELRKIALEKREKARQEALEKR